jgi:hypothetical protein
VFGANAAVPLASLRAVPEERLARIARQWTESPDVSADLQVIEAANIIQTLRKVSNKGRGIYLLHHWDCGTDRRATNRPQTSKTTQTPRSMQRDDM